MAHRLTDLYGHRTARRPGHLRAHRAGAGGRHGLGRGVHRRAPAAPQGALGGDRRPARRCGMPRVGRLPRPEPRRHPRLLRGVRPALRGPALSLRPGIPRLPQARLRPHHRSGHHRGLGHRHRRPARRRASGRVLAGPRTGGAAPLGGVHPEGRARSKPQRNPKSRRDGESPDRRRARCAREGARAFPAPAAGHPAPRHRVPHLRRVHERPLHRPHPVERRPVRQPHRSSRAAHGSSRLRAEARRPGLLLPPGPPLRRSRLRHPGTARRGRERLLGGGGAARRRRLRGHQPGGLGAHRLRRPSVGAAGPLLRALRPRHLHGHVGGTPCEPGHSPLCLPITRPSSAWPAS